MLSYCSCDTLHAPAHINTLATIWRRSWLASGPYSLQSYGVFLHVGGAGGGGSEVFTDELALADDLAKTKAHTHLEQSQPPSHGDTHRQLRKLNNLPHKVRELLFCGTAALQYIYSSRQHPQKHN